MDTFKYYWESDYISEKESSLKADIDDQEKCIQVIMKNIVFSLSSEYQINISEE